MNKGLLFMVLMLLMGARNAVYAKELTVSDIEYIDNGYNDEYPVIILTKEGSALNVHLKNYSAHPDTEEFAITPKMSGGSDGEPCSVSIGISYTNNSFTAVITTFNVSFNVHGIEDSSFYLSCWWFEGQVTLTEGEPLELWENKNISKDGVTYTLDNKTKTATLSNGRFVEGEYNIPSELDYGGQIFKLKSINYPAFAYNTSLTSVIIPQSVTNIGNAVFYRCSNLTDLYCYAENVPTTGVNVFNESSIASATLHVPAASIEAYRTTSPWKDFGNIVAIEDKPYQPLPFLEGNPIWIYKHEHIPRGLVWEDDGWYYRCWHDTGDRCFTYYFLGGQKEIDGKLYTMMGEITSKGEDMITFNRWYPVREENGVVYTITDSLPGVIQHYYNDDNVLTYLQQGNECVLYNFSTDIGEMLYPQNEGSTVKSFDTYQLLDGTECRVLKTYWGHYDLYEKLGFLSGDFDGIMDPFVSWPVPTDGSVHSSRLNAYYQDNVMLYKAPDAQEGLCVNDTIWTREDAEAYAPSYKADPYHDEVMSFIRQLQRAVEPVAFTAGQMATIVLPTEPDASMGKYYRLDRVEGNEIIFEQELHPQAHVPYIIVPNEDFSIEMSTLELAGLRSDTVSIEGISFIGSFVREVIEEKEGFYIDIIDTTPDCSFENDKQMIGALRAYLLVTWDDPYNHGGTKVPTEKMQIVLHDRGTGIAEVKSEKLKVKNGDAAIYDLSGRRIVNAKSLRGIYIKDRRKQLR